MTTYLLIDEIKTRLTDELQNWYLEHPIYNEVYRKAPNVMIGQLPAKSGSMPSHSHTEKTEQHNESDIPFVLIRPTEITFFNNSICEKVCNIAIICGIYSSESYKKYERGIEEIVNLIDRIVLSIKKFRLWGKSSFYHDEEIKCIFGLPKSIDPYEIGLQAEAPFFASVVLTSFKSKVKIPEVELNTILN